MGGPLNYVIVEMVLGDMLVRRCWKMWIFSIFALIGWVACSSLLGKCGVWLVNGDKVM